MEKTAEKEEFESVYGGAAVPEKNTCLSQFVAFPKSANYVERSGKSWRHRQTVHENYEKTPDLCVVLDYLPDAVALFDVNQGLTFRYVNSAYVDLTGCSAAELIGSPLQAHGFLPEITQLHAMTELLANGLFVNDLPMDVISRDGNLTPTSLSARSLKIEGKSFIVFSHRDITERNYVAQKLEQSEQRWRMAIEGLGDALWDWDVAADKVYRSPRFLAILKLPGSAAVVSGAMHTGVIHDEDRPVFNEYLRDLLSGVTDAFVGQCRLRTPGGDIIWAGYRCCAVDRDKEHRVRRVIGTLRDITQQRNQQQALEAQFARLTQAGRLLALGEMVSAIGHEINQPLAAIASYAGILARKTAEQPELAIFAKKIEDQALRAGQIIWTMRDQARQGVLQLEPQSVPSLVVDVLEWLRLEPHVLEFVIRTRIPDDLPKVLADRVQIQQVLLNLLRNAVQVSRENNTRRRLLLRAYRDVKEQVVVIEVADRGPGLPADFEEGEFKPFFTTRPEGLGLGLSICHSIITRHGGRFWSRSRRHGGAVFVFTLPVVTGNQNGRNGECA